MGMILVVGLGNPGDKYAGDRHNVGFMVADELARRCRADPFRSKFSGELARVRLAGRDGWLLKPMTYMNESGRCVGAAAGYYKIEPTDIVVIHDELDLPFGTVRLKKGGGHAGHNGLRSLVSHLGGPDFCRVRIGISRPGPQYQGDAADYVLSPFSAAERTKMPTTLRTAAQSVLDIAARGLQPAMKKYNTRPKKKKDAPATDSEKASEPSERERAEQETLTEK